MGMILLPGAHGVVRDKILKCRYNFHSICLVGPPRSTQTRFDSWGNDLCKKQKSGLERRHAIFGMLRAQESVHFPPGRSCRKEYTEPRGSINYDGWYKEVEEVIISRSRC